MVGLRLFLIFPTLFFLGSFCASSKPYSLNPSNEKFTQAVKNFEKRKYQPAAAFAFSFMKGKKPTHENFQNAVFIFAYSLDQLKFHYPASEYFLEVVRNGAEKELILQSLRSVLETIELRPYDANLLEKELIAGSEFEFFPKDLEDQIRYLQGKMDYQRNDIDWSKKFFSKIEPDSTADLKVRYATAITELKEGRPDQAIIRLEEIIQKAPPKTRIRNLALQSLARLQYEEKKYSDALASYGKIDSSVLLWDEIFLEKAWNEYQLEDYERALGYLHALHAPIFSTSFQPERFLLIGMILKKLCRFDDVGETIAEFREKYGPTIHFIRSGRSLKESSIISQAARTKHILDARAKLAESVKTELKTLLEQKNLQWKETGLTSHLQAIYGLKQKELQNELKFREAKALEEVADELLYYNEQMNLLEYETRMDRFRRSHFTENRPPEALRPPRSLLSSVVHWPYKKEFWIDELDHFRVQVDSQCEE